jgi:KipI family sensor histidine kinase inhibitor
LWTRRPAGFLDAVPGARTLLVLIDPAVFDRAVLAERPAAVFSAARTVVLPTVYDGPDLTELCGQLRLDAVQAHAEAEHVVQFLGFAPGFAYMTGGFAVPRLRTPRVRVPRGSVAVADGYTGIYPAETPGGWWLIGRIAEELFDPFADPPSLLRPGDRVIFERVATLSGEPHQRPVRSTHRGEPLLQVGKFVGNPTVQGGPRYGHAQYGVPAGGAMDLASLAAANQLLGNEPLAPGLECLFSTPELQALAPVRIAWNGRVHELQPGQTLPHQKGPFCSYLAVDGGLAQDPPGAPRRLSTKGDVFYRATAPAASLPRRLPPLPVPRDPVELRVLPGPQEDWFENPQQLYETEWRLSPQTDRRGARLEGPPLLLNRPSDLPSEGTAPGAVQVPGDGKPIVLGPDRPVTGGYAKIGAVIWDDLPLLAQARPGARIRFARARARAP